MVHDICGESGDQTTLTIDVRATFAQAQDSVVSRGERVNRTHGIHDKQPLVPWQWGREEKLSPGSLHDVLHRHIVGSELSGRRISRKREIDRGRSVVRGPVSELEFTWPLISLPGLFHEASSLVFVW